MLRSGIEGAGWRSQLGVVSCHAVRSPSTAAPPGGMEGAECHAGFVRSLMAVRKHDVYLYSCEKCLIESVYYQRAAETGGWLSAWNFLCWTRTGANLCWYKCSRPNRILRHRRTRFTCVTNHIRKGAVHQHTMTITMTWKYYACSVAWNRFIKASIQKEACVWSIMQVDQNPIKCFSLFVFQFYINNSYLTIDKYNPLRSTCACISKYKTPATTKTVLHNLTISHLYMN